MSAQSIIDGELVQNESDFNAALADGRNVFRFKTRLPDHVFSQEFAAYYLFAYGQIQTKTFPELLHSLAISFSESCVTYMSLDPDPFYYFNNCGFYGVARFDVHSVRERFYPVMWRGGAADSFMVRGGDAAAMWGSSGKWGLYIDRRSWELCVLGASQRLDNLLDAYIGTMTWKQLQDYIRHEYRAEPGKANDFLERFATNFPSAAAVR